jgi:glucosyl-dolichyl phosphate glucuronosyltransferase
MRDHSHSPKVSCVICTYRRPDVLAAAIGSLIDQSIPSTAYEIIVVDNNSGDTTSEVVGRYFLETLPKVSYVLEPNQGLSHARNTGVEHARGEIVAFLDDDAEADPNWLAALLEVYDNVPEVWAVGGKVIPIWHGERPSWLTNEMLRSLSLVDWGDDERPMAWSERIIGTNCSFRKQVFAKVGQFATNLGRKSSLLTGNEDTEIQERIHRLGRLVYYTPDAVVHHHVPRERMTKRYAYIRTFGSGRSQAILIARQGHYKPLLKQALLSGALLPWLCLGLVKNMAHEGKRLRTFQGLAFHSGFLYQAIGLLLSERAYTDST